MKGKHPLYINIKGELVDFAIPRVMGIMNVTPDSFFESSRKQTEQEIADRTIQLKAEGADIIDIGAYSSRPNAAFVSEEEEMKRLDVALPIVFGEYPEAIVSIDTFRSAIARKCVEKYGVALINDISAGELDRKMIDTIADLRVPYIIMHMKGNPQTMMHQTDYENLQQEVFLYFARKMEVLFQKGVNDIIIDPGFGFSKTTDHNYTLMNCLEDFSIFEQPLLIGISRKSMVWHLLNCSPDESLAGTMALNAIALTTGANIQFGIKDAVDVLCVAFFLYKTYRLMKNSGSIALFTGVLSFVAIWILVSKILEMRLMGAILDQFISIGFIILVILFQDEIKRFLQAMGSRRGWKFLVKFLNLKGSQVSDDLSYIMPIVLASMNLAKTKTGALIVIKQEANLDLYIQTGEVLNASLSSRLIENIFFKNSPLHDGAIIISDKKIRAAACILPVSQKNDIPKELGLRHRSALGVSQETDAKVIIVSEQTGRISLAQQGRLHLNISGEELQKLLISK